MNAIGRAAAAMIAAAVVAGCTHATDGIATPARTLTPGNSAAAVPSTSTAPSDEDAAIATVKAFADSYNSQNWEAYVELMCAPMRAKFTGVVMDYLKKGRIQSGPTTASGITITINGDNATASFDSHNEAMGSRRVSIPLKREEDGWKVCQL